MPPPPELMDELVERSSSASHRRSPPLAPPRLRPGFRRRFREFHRTPPMLGFLCNLRDAHEIEVARFVPTTTSSCSPRAGGDQYRHWRVDDARHGRVLLSRQTVGNVVLMVWDPITDQRQELPVLPKPVYNWNWTVAIVCAGAATGTCDHLDCHRSGPFLVVYIGASFSDTFTCVYSSDAAAWSKPISTDLPRRHIYKNLVQSVLVGKSLYFMFHKSYEVLEYDLELCKVVSVIQLPLYSNWRRLVLITTEDGEMGYATVIECKLNLWSWKKADSKGDAGWLQRRVIDPDGLLRVNNDPTTLPKVVGYADGVGVIFLKMNDVFFTVDLKTYETKE
uniref:F-box protein AT5G49610-like beta-propeller domain-containing protein n=1 Tax=Setaria italica TaxID=4555 RepID=K4A0P9_SETIT